MGRVMTTRKAAIRREVRASRARRLRERGRDDLADEQDGMLASWVRVLELLGLPLDVERAQGPPALFVPTSTEPDVRPVIGAHPRTLLPVLVTPQGVALPGPEWAVYEGDSASLSRPDPRRPAQPMGELLGPGALGEAAVVLVAALAVDLSGTRLGQGGGWYDRALAHLRAGAPVVAAVFDEEVLPASALPREGHDHPVDAVITPTRSLLLG